MRGRKKPKATDQSLLTHRKETPNIIQVFPISMPSVKMILAPGDAALSLFFVSLKMIAGKSSLKEFCLQYCVVFPDG